MNAFPPYRMMERSTEAALEWTKGQLSQAGLRALQTFDLQAVRGSPAGCPCPQHSSRGCDCRIVILLVYGETGSPVTLVLHGNDGQTWISIPGNGQTLAGSEPFPAIRSALGLSE